MKNHTLLSRFLSDTPVFWKKLHLVGLAIIALATGLFDAGIDHLYVSVVGAIGGTLALISQFAIKDIAIINEAADPIDAAGKLIPELKDQAGAIIKELTPLEQAFQDHEKTKYTRPPVDQS